MPRRYDGRHGLDRRQAQGERLGLD